MLSLSIAFPNISPEIFSVELLGYSFALRWYALAYIVGILLGIRIVKKALSRASIWSPMRPVMGFNQADTLALWLIFGVILGGRLGYVLFYQPEFYLANPSEILKVWQGGMSFHGGLAGVSVALLAFCSVYRLPILSVADLIALATPPALFLGRIANFINAELWGHPSNLAWAVVFPGDAAQNCPNLVGACARHPTQLYEAFFEGLLLALLLMVLFRRGWIRRPGTLAATFLIGYAIARFVIEFFRNPDAQFIAIDNPYGYVIGSAYYGLTMGQTLTLPVMLLGILLLVNSVPKYQPYTAPLGIILAYIGKPFAFVLRVIVILLKGLGFGLRFINKLLIFIITLPRIFEKK